MKTLLDNTKIKSMKLKNRFVRSATWERLADEKGHLTEDLIKVYEDLAKGGVGLIITGYAYVMENEQPNARMMGIYEDSFIEEYKRLTDMVHKYDSKIVLQIVYGGSQTNYQPDERKIWGPSSVPELGTKVVPEEMSKEDINTLIKAFSEAALRAKKAGFDGVQLHGAHGYLLSQFLNPYHNRRTDEYGGSIENRARIIFEVYEEVRQKVGKDYPVLIKLNCSDFIEEKGLTFEDSKYVAKELSSRGIDAIEISGGIPASKYLPSRKKINTPEEESYHKDYASDIAKEISAPIILVGGNKSLEVMEDILHNTKIEYFALSRPLLRESNLINRWNSGDREKAKCISCNQCFNFQGNICIFNRKKN